jgi:hypothetical protein
MFLTWIFIVMTAFATVSNWISRRRGSGISRRPYGNVYSDATAARRTPSATGRAPATDHPPAR